MPCAGWFHRSNDHAAEVGNAASVAPERTGRTGPGDPTDASAAATCRDAASTLDVSAARDVQFLVHAVAVVVEQVTHQLIRAGGQCHGGPTDRTRRDPLPRTRGT